MPEPMWIIRPTADDMTIAWQGKRIAALERLHAELVEAVRWERECCQDIRPLAAWGDLYVRHGEDYVDGVADDLRAIQDAARAAVDALVGGEE